MSEKLKNKLYRFLRTLPEFKTLSMDRQGEIIGEITKMITEKTENKQFLSEGPKEEKDMKHLVALIKGKKKPKGLPSEKFMKRIFGPEVMKELKKGKDYE